MSSVIKFKLDAEVDPFEVSSAGQALLRVAVVTLIAIVAGALVLPGIFPIVTRQMGGRAARPKPCCILLEGAPQTWYKLYITAFRSRDPHEATRNHRLHRAGAGGPGL